MDNLNFVWDDANIRHIAGHDVTPEESQEILLANPLEYDFDPDVEGEPRWTYIGETSSGRILLVVFTIRAEKIRVVTAFEPIKQIKVFYLTAKGEPQ